MIQITLDQLYTWINAFLFPFSRIAALLAVAPLFGDSAIPRRIKTGAAVALSIGLAPALGPMPAVAPGSWDSFLIIGQQILIGLAMGYALRVVFATVQTAGELVGLQMGLSFATFLDPSTGSNTTVLSRLFNVLALLLFLSLDGHLLMLSGLMHAFEAVPITSAPLHAAGLGILVQWSGELMTSALLMALPLITALLTLNLAMGILNRTAPQMSVFSVGFPISLGAGLIALMVVLPRSQGFLERFFAAGLETMLRIAQALGGG